MSKNKKHDVSAEETVDTAPQTEETVVEEAVEEPSAGEAGLNAELAVWEDKYLRLAAEYDNFRKRSAKEKEAMWTNAKCDTAGAFLPVYDNLERALNQPCTDEAYKKGVEMTMTQFKDILAKLGIEAIPALGETFDPNLHNAVMHVEDESAEENTIVEVFQTGFRTTEKVVRFSMVKVAN